jgi:hypothetical protein
MFLDAATLLHGQPLQDLRCAWIAMVQFDDGFADGPDAAACVVDDCLAELVAASLVSSDDGRRQQGSWEDVPHRAEQRCVVFGLALHMLQVPCPQSELMLEHQCVITSV